MGIEIRAAILSDIAAIGEIIKLAFDDDIDEQRVQYLMTLDHNYIYVAVQSGKVVGFVENFVTISQSDQIRLELDLLAVHPDARGHGIGKQLIDVSLKKAQSLGVHQLRALVAKSNVVMQNACQRMGLEQSDTDFGLYVRSCRQPDGIPGDAPKFHLLWIENLTYSGIWLEGVIDQQAINNADGAAYFYHGHILGAVVAKADTDTIDLLLENGFEYINDYHRWIFSPKND